MTRARITASNRSLVRAKSLLAALLFTGAGMAELSGQDLVSNGNFELFTGGAPSTWSYKENGTRISSIRATEPSPFTSVYPAGSTSVMLTGATGNIQLLDHSLSAYQDPVLNVSFEFKVSATGRSTNGWGLTLVDSTTSAETFSVYLNRNLDQQRGGIYAHVFGTTHEIAPIVPGTWYQIVFQLDQANRLVTGEVTPFGESPIEFSLPLWNANPSTVLTVREIPYPFSFPTRSDLYLDNVSIVATPEPMASTFLAIAAVTLLGLRRHRGQ